MEKLTRNNEGEIASKIGGGIVDTKFTTASGPGGQNVNKVATKAQLFFDLEKSDFTEGEKEILKKKLKLTNEGLLIIESQKTRSQFENKQDAEQKLIQKLQGALEVKKPRKETKPNKNSIRKRLDEKTLHSQKKSLRHRPTSEE